MVALLKVGGILENEITQPLVAQFTKADFTGSLIGQISWSHHLVLLINAHKGQSFLVHAEYIGTWCQQKHIADAD